MFRRRSATAEAASDVHESTATGGKGRPTPSRREAEDARKARLKPTVDKKTAARADRERLRADRERSRQGMLAGDTRYLPARDQGPVRRYARDYVDSRRSMGELMLPLVLVFLVVSFVPNVSVRGYAILAFYIYMLTLFVDLALLSRRVKRRAAARYPAEDVKGVGLYAAMRAVQLRRMRLPRPAVKVGDPV